MDYKFAFLGIISLVLCGCVALTKVGPDYDGPPEVAAATTVLGVIPLIQDVFWVSMAVTIMAGLTFGTVLTMVIVPVLYAGFYKVKKEQKSSDGENEPKSLDVVAAE